MISAIRVCERCGAKIPADAPEGGCPGCLLENGLNLLAEEAVVPHARDDCGADEEVRSAEINDQDDLVPGPPGRGDPRFGIYEIERRPDGSLYELGRGGMGVTYRAVDTSLQRKVALKIIKAGIARRSANAQERFMREARMAAALRHENIATVYQFGIREDTGQYFYAMELIEGETLEERVHRAGPLSVRTTIDIAQQITAALAIAERQGLLHRDLKPANLMLVSADGETVAAAGKNEKVVVKIIDFGLAKALDAPVDPLSLTRGGFVGTPEFASPEQFEHSWLDVRSDIYSLGATLWFALTGHTPFVGHKVEEVHHAQQSDALPIGELKAARIPSRLRALLESMLALEPARRPGIHELAAQLQRCAAEAQGEGRIRVALTAATILVLGASGFLIFVSLRIGDIGRPAAAVQNLPSNLPVPEKSLAVLPFENLSEEKANAYFAEGIQNEILAKLATVADLKVISRTSTAKYQSKPDNLKTVAQELGVSTILEGAVQKAGDKVRVNVHLIDARADTYLWAKSYDRDFKDVLVVESEVSQEIAEALQAKLSPRESHVLASARTPDTEAYDLFLRGEYELRQAESSWAAEALDRADRFYRQALARDPNFAEAAAELANSRISRHWFASPLAPTELEEVKSIIDHALALAPNSPEAHLALGLFFYRAHRQYNLALAEFNRTLELQPNNSLARQSCAWVYRRLGEWERSLASFQRAQELDPLDAGIPMSTGATYEALRLWKDAERAELQALAIDPHNAAAALYLLVTRLNSTGDVDSTRRALDGFPEAIRALATLISSPGADTGGDMAGIVGFPGIPVYFDIMERRFGGALQALEKEVVNDDRGHLQQLARSVALHVLAGEPEAAKSAGEEALPLLEARLRERPDDTFTMTALSWVYLALGRNADALRLSGQAADSISIEKDALSGPTFQNGLAQIEARAGSPEKAIKRLRRLLSIPAGQDVSIGRLKIDPVWDPIRNRPDFEELVSGPEQIGPNK